MEIDQIFKIAAVGILITVLQQLLERSGRSDQALMVTIAGLVVVMAMVLNQIKTLFSLIRSIFGL